MMPSKSRSSEIATDAESVAGITRPVLNVVGDTTTLDELAVFLLEHRVTYAAVLDVGGDIQGLVSMTDVVREFVLGGLAPDERAERGERGERGRRAERAEHAEHARASSTPGGRRSLRHPRLAPAPAREHRPNVRDIMLPFVLMIDARASIAQAAAVMAARGAHHLVVMSKARVVGIVEARDVLRWLSRRLGVYVPDDVEARLRLASSGGRAV